MKFSIVSKNFELFDFWEFLGGFARKSGGGVIQRQVSTACHSLRRQVLRLFWGGAIDSKRIYSRNIDQMSTPSREGNSIGDSWIRTARPHIMVLSSSPRRRQKKFAETILRRNSSVRFHHNSESTNFARSKAHGDSKITQPKVNNCNI